MKNRRSIDFMLVIVKFDRLTFDIASFQERNRLEYFLALLFFLICCQLFGVSNDFLDLFF